MAIKNDSDKASIQLYSFRAPNGTCLQYKGDWGPGDTVGWPDIFVANPEVSGNNADYWPDYKAYTDRVCGADNEVRLIGPAGGDIEKGYLVTEVWHSE